MDLGLIISALIAIISIACVIYLLGHVKGYNAGLDYALEVMKENRRENK